MKQSTYRKLRAQGYDIGAAQPEIVGFYLELWRRLGRPAPVLEPMCGTGLNLIPFLEAGADTDGLDASPFMLAVCREKCQAKGLNCMLYEQFLEQMALPRRYRFIFIPDRSYGHIYDRTLAAECLRRMHAQLLPGGWLVLDVRPPASIDGFGKSGQVDYALDEYDDGATIFTTGYWDHLEEGRVIRMWNKMERFVNDVLMETEIFDYRERLYELNEMKQAFEQAGFDEIHITKAYEHEGTLAERDGMVFLGRRS
jgi:ubiquinone/menaquinone biosynthesis C-methylase UbiE